MVTGGSEVIVGIIRDAAFGPVVMFGLGGVFVETLQDTTFRLAPTTPTEALRMLDDVRGCSGCCAVFEGCRRPIGRRSRP